MTLPRMHQPSYPTRCLDFLSNIDRDESVKNGYPPSTNGNIAVQPAALTLKVIVVGAGLGGLATSIALARRGHSVTVLEQAPELGEVGAGIQIPPNSSRLLLSWGLDKFLGDKVVEPEGMSFLRWQDGRKIAYTKLVPEFRQNFKAPYYVVHRAHFHDAMLKLALHLGVTVCVDSKVDNYSADTASVKLTNGKTYTGDLVVAADGVKSQARSVVLNGVDQPPVKTGFAAYRATVNVAKMKKEPDLAWLLEKPSLNIWIGEDKHIMTYTIAGGSSFNMVLSHVDSSDPQTWNQDSVIQEMRRCFTDWDPRVVKIINMIDRTMKWPLMNGVPLSNWVAASAKLLILGDAAHAMVPYMSQGAAMAVEDGAGLGEVLSLINTRDQIPAALAVFEDVRRKRSYQMQEASMLNGKLWHFADGPVQRARDASTRPELTSEHFLASANQWSDPVTQWWSYGYDAETEILDAWKHSNKCVTSKI